MTEKSKPIKEPTETIPQSRLDDNLIEELKIKIISLCGDINEERAEDVILSLLTLKEFYKNIPATDDSNITQTQSSPIDFYISTWGGDALSMFAIYDIMRMVRCECEIHTYGVGKVMSGGVLLLAAGTKGKRKIGKNCRVMMHSVAGGPHGTIYNLENEMEEIRWIQEQHIDALVDETNITKKQLKRMLDKKVNIYLNAEQAVKRGIADIII